jgi:hypothetical protein
MLELKNVAIIETGVRDGLGDRLTGFDRAAGETLHILRVRPELAAFGATLDEVVARYVGRSDRQFLNVRGVARESSNPRPLVVFEHLEGDRLDDIVTRANARSVVPDVTIALFLADHLLAALGSLARAAQSAHGALSLGRILVTPRGRVVIAEHVFGPLLGQLGFSHARLWRELRIAMPEKPVPGVCDYRADVAQVAMITLSLILGRPLAADEYPEHLEDLLGEVKEIAWIRAGDALANAVGAWLDLALPLPGRLVFDDAAQAREALSSMLPADSAVVGTRADLTRPRPPGPRRQPPENKRKSRSRWRRPRLTWRHLPPIPPSRPAWPRPKPRNRPKWRSSSRPRRATRRRRNSRSSSCRRTSSTT